MAKIIPFRNDETYDHKNKRLGSRKVVRRKKPDLEELGQLNLFDQTPQVSLTRESNYFEEALVLDEQSDPRAEQYYHKAIDRNQNTSDAYCNLGIIADFKKDPSLAIHYFSLALKNNPRHLEAHYNLANVYAEQGNMTLCRMHYEVAIQIDDAYAPPYYNLALVLIALKEFDAARQTLDRYIVLSPDHSFEDDQSILQLLNQIKAISS
jgi:tetratricopeptide (TPR) repeat protein